MVICVRTGILKLLLHCERLNVHMCNRLPHGRMVMLFYPVSPQGMGRRGEGCSEQARCEEKLGSAA